MKKVKVYRVMLKDDLNGDIFYTVDAPNKRIARWCGANLFNNVFTTSATWNAQKEQYPSLSTLGKR